MRPLDLTVEEVEGCWERATAKRSHWSDYSVPYLVSELNTLIETKRQAFAGAQPRRERERLGYWRDPST